MGVFDNVNFTMDCPECGTNMTGFQTKESQYMLGLVEITDVHNFYNMCYKCNTWVELDRPYQEVERGHLPPKTLKDAESIGYVLRHRKRGEKF